MRPGRHDRGAATLVVLAAAGLLMFVGLALSGVAALVSAQRSAQSAADLAALAGAGAVASGGDACSLAAAIAEANRSLLAGCVLDGGEVTVAVTVPGPRLGARRYDVTAQARAGPAR